MASGRLEDRHAKVLQCNDALYIVVFDFESIDRALTRRTETGAGSNVISG